MYIYVKVLIIIMIKLTKKVIKDIIPSHHFSPTDLSHT